MKILITGGSGLLGRYLLRTKQNDTVALTYNKNFHSNTPDTIWYHLDIRNRADIFDIFELFRPDIVIHCAAVGSVDFAENEGGYQPTFDVNVTGTKHIIDACNGYKSKLIYVSSNAVFSGKNPPYDEKSPLEPINRYGVIKKQAERLVRNMAKKWLIVRPFMLYGWPYVGGRGNWGNVTVNRLSNNGSLEMVNDHIWQPTYAKEAAETIWKLAHQDHEIYNVASSERVTLYEFGQKICDVFNFKKDLIRPINSEKLSIIMMKLGTRIAPRPKDTSYDLVKLSKASVKLSDIKTGLEKMKEERE